MESRLDEVVKKTGDVRGVRRKKRVGVNIMGKR
jgi:hypothetical protein